MTVSEAKIRIENELREAAQGFGAAEHLVKYSVEISENEIDGAPVDITYVFGSLSLGKEDASEDDRLYLPLDAELDDEDNISDERFEENLTAFKARLAPIKERLTGADDPEAELAAIIAEFDREMDEKYRLEIEKLNKIAKRNLIIAAVAAGVMLVVATVIMVLGRLG